MTSRALRRTGLASFGSRRVAHNLPQYAGPSRAVVPVGAVAPSAIPAAVPGPALYAHAKG